MLAPCNFKNQITGEVSIALSWRKESTRREVSCQTGELRTREEETQTTLSALQVVNRADKEVGHERRAIQATLDGLQYVYAGIDVDEAKLAAFLEASKEDLLAILYRNAKSPAFDNYVPNWSPRRTDLATAYTLTSPYAVEGDLHALALSWSVTGALLAVGYGRLDTAGWCPSGGFVSVWNLARPDTDAHLPHHTLETDAFVTSLAFHPARAAVLAVGLYSGAVRLFGAVTDAARVSTGAAGGPLHREPVVALRWLQCAQETRAAHRHLLCSAAADGLVLYWAVAGAALGEAAAFLVAGRRVGAAGLQAVAHVRGVGAGGREVPSADAALLVGLESGDAGRALVPPIRPTGGEAAALEVDWRAGHRGPVQSIDASPFFHNLYLTCSSDGSVHLCSALERQTLASMQPSVETKHFLYDAKFSPFRPSVFATVSRSAFLHVYDLQASPSRPVASVEAGVDGAPVLCVAFNHISPEWLATGDMRGCVRVWRMPNSLLQTTELERAAIRSVHEKKQDGEDPIRALFGFSL